MVRYEDQLDFYSKLIIRRLLYFQQGGAVALRRRLSDKDKERRLVRRSSSKRKDKENGGADPGQAQVLTTFLISQFYWTITFYLKIIYLDLDPLETTYFFLKHKNIYLLAVKFGHYYFKNNQSNPYTKVTGCLFVCVFVPKDLANR